MRVTLKASPIPTCRRFESHPRLRGRYDKLVNVLARNTQIIASDFWTFNDRKASFVDSAGLELARRSLRQRLLEMVNVQACFLHPQLPILIVQTWTGVIIHVHFVLVAIKTRQIKRILQEATDSGIGSMFLLDR